MKLQEYKALAMALIEIRTQQFFSSNEKIPHNALLLKFNALRAGIRDELAELKQECQAVDPDYLGQYDLDAINGRLLIKLHRVSRLLRDYRATGDANPGINKIEKFILNNVQ